MSDDTPILDVRGGTGAHLGEVITDDRDGQIFVCSDTDQTRRAEGPVGDGGPKGYEEAAE